MSSFQHARVPLLLAGLVAGLQSLVLIGFAIADFADLQPDRPGIGLGVGLMLLGLGVGLALAAWAVSAGRHIGRGPVVVTQLIGLGLSWNLIRSDATTGDTRTVGMLIALSAAIVLVSLATPAARATLADRPTEAPM